MPLEIERKFLLSSDGWRAGVTRSLQLTDALLIQEDGRKLRLRFCDGQASLTFKGKRKGLGREELELPLDAGLAQAFLAQAGDRVLRKTRHLVPWGGLTWEVDVYEPPLEGIALAEVELPAEDHPLTLPPWVGREVTGDPAWRKINMLQARRG